MAAQAAVTSVVLSQLALLRTRVERRFPALSSLRGQSPAQESKSFKLRPVDARAPQAGRREGRIEVVFRTPILGFRDDVVIRIRPDPDGARVDIRSTSRYGRHDFGTNASRVSALSEAIDEAVDNLKPDKSVEQVKKPKKPDPKAKTQPADKRR